MVCPNCGCTEFDTQTFQEDRGSKTRNKTTFKLQEKKHGFFWWVFVGWWWMPIKLFLWIVAFPFMAILHLGRKKKYVGVSHTTGRTRNQIAYTTIYVCQNCGKQIKRRAR